jgi:hypothetical protein
MQFQPAAKCLDVIRNEFGLVGWVAIYYQEYRAAAPSKEVLQELPEQRGVKPACVHDIPKGTQGIDGG